MPYSRRRRSKTATHQKRNQFGRFTKDSSTTSAQQMTGAGEQIEHLFGFHENKKDDSALIDVKVSNPLHRIVEILKEIKNKQSTTVSLRFTIPLIALPIVFFLVFQLGRAQSACQQIFTTKQGILRTLTVQVPKNNESFIHKLFSFIPSIPNPAKPAELVTQMNTLVFTQDEKAITLKPAQNINVAIFQNQQVLISGTYSACTETMTLDSTQNIRTL